MKDFWIYTDCHAFTPQSLGTENLLNLDRKKVLELNAYSIGDNFDRKNCTPEWKESLEFEYAKHKEIFRDRFLTGNHDVMHDRYGIIKADNVLLVHGDFVWGDERSEEFRASDAYQGYGIVKQTIAWMRHIIGAFYTKSDKDKCAELAKKYMCDTLIMGHKHPAKLIDFMHNGVRIICCPRGYTKVTL